MGWADKFKRKLGGRGNPALATLEGWMQGRKGIEGYVEPQTTTNPTTLLLVDRDGDHARAPVRLPEDAARFCEKRGIPVYDAAVVGYPKRIQDFERGRRSDDAAYDAAFAELEK